MLKKLNSNNKGFSLAELLVAVTILGISVGMVLHAFSTSANITARSRAFGEATMAADNIAEAVNAYTRDSFMQGSGAEMLGITADDVYKADDRQVAVKGIQAGNSTYDAVITYSEGEPLLDGEAVGGDEAGIYELNNYEIAQYTAMDGSFTQSWQEDQNPDAKSDNEFYRKAGHPAVINTLENGSEVPAYKAKNRIISVNVYTDTSDRIYMDVVYNYTYTYEQYVYVKGVQQYKTQNGVQVPETQNAQFLYTWSSRVTFNQDDPTCYSTTAEGANAEPTVFIMYYPYYRDNTARTGPFYGQAYPRYAQYDINPDKTNMTDSYKNLAAASVQRNYNTDGGLKTRDLIIINNLGNVPTKFFIVKQRMVQGGAPVTDEFLTTSNLDFRETEFEGNPASEYFCKAGQDVVITFDCDDELFLGGVYNGIDATYPLLENGAKLERDGKTYTLTVFSDVFKANDVLNYHYVELYAGTNTNDYVVSIAFVVDF